MQRLVYVFVALAALGVAAMTYFGLTFTPIEAAVTAIAVASAAIVLIERQLRRRAESRLEKAVEDLSRLLSTDAQAGSVLSRRINALVEINAAPRLEAVEADLAVLGTVVRQVTEAVSEFEQQRRIALSPPGGGGKEAMRNDPDFLSAPVIPLEMLRHAVSSREVVYHVEPIVVLPLRKPFAYDLVPRLRLEDGEFADRPDFMPRHGGADVVARIEAEGLDEAIVIARRSRAVGAPIKLHVPVSRASLESATADVLLATLEANLGVAGSLHFLIEQSEFKALGSKERAALIALAKTGVGLSLGGAASLRFDYTELEGLGFGTIRIDTTRFLASPSEFTDFHPADVAAYGRRFGIELIASGVVDEQQLLHLFEDGISLAQGPHIAAPGPVRDDLHFPRTPLPARDA